MLTQVELANLQKQINAAFDKDRKRIEALEQRVKELEAAQTKAPASKSKKAA